VNAIPRRDMCAQHSATDHPRFIAFYLPQFYPTPYNDEWWGKGFTEWTNVVKTRPRFRGHYQPHLPADLGFYDLRLPETREAQANLAREYGIYGFCYYHYWFNGRRILDRPLEEVLKLGKPDLPFCICWANENWTRAWEGHVRNMLIEQHYSHEDDVAHIRHLIPALSDKRYIRIEGKLLILIYRIELLPDPRQTSETWRHEARKAGLGDLFLVNIQSNYVRVPEDSTTFGFDAAMRLQPNVFIFYAPKIIRGLRALITSPRRLDKIYDYRKLYRSWAKSSRPSYRAFECVTPMWDNSARRARKAVMFTNATPENYERWLRQAVERTPLDSEGHRWLFLNAWNEWGEGCHLEPCQKWGRAYLEATKRVHDSFAPPLAKQGG
jgi:lipopolysaccharide biosynthesis protein